MFFLNVLNWQVGNPLIFRACLILKMGTTVLALRLASRVHRVTPASLSTGSSRRYQVSAVHTSKACNVISKYTAFVPVDMSKSRYLPTVVGYPNSSKAGGQPGHS